MAEIPQDKPCSWCEQRMTQYLMCQPFCDTCAQQFRQLHADITKGESNGRK